VHVVNVRLLSNGLNGWGLKSRTSKKVITPTEILVRMRMVILLPRFALNCAGH